MKRHVGSPREADIRANIYIINCEEDSSLALEIKRFLTQYRWGSLNLLTNIPEPEFSLKPLHEAQFVLVLCSKAALRSEHVRSEIEEAVKLQKQIISAELENGIRPEILNGTELLDFSSINRAGNTEDIDLSNREMRLYWALLPLIRAPQFLYEAPDFLYIWKRINWFERIGSVLIPIGLIVLCVVLIPFVGASFIQREGGRESSKFKVSFSLPETKPVTIDGELQVEVPNVMRVSETKAATANLTLAGSEVGTRLLTARLDSPSFAITPVDSETAVLRDNGVSWEWLMIPKQVGQHAVSLHIQDARISMTPDGSQSQDFRVQGESIVALITVLTDLGITSRESAILKAVGVLLGVIGTIVSYPLWKMIFGRKLTRSARRKSRPSKSRRRK